MNKTPLIKVSLYKVRGMGDGYILINRHVTCNCDCYFRVSWWKWHAFISLTVASLFLAIMSGLNLTKIVTAYETGVGSVLGHLVGILALGTILGKMMSDSGAGMQVADFFIRFFGVKKLPWAMLFAGFVIGIPVFLK